VRIGFATVDWSQSVTDSQGRLAIGGSGHYRCGLPAKYLAELGHETFVGRPVLLGDKTETPRFAVADMGASLDVDVTPEMIHDNLDVVVFQRMMHVDILRDIVEYGPKTGQLIVNDVDDHFWALDKRNLAHKMTDTSVRPEENTEIYLQILKASDLVTASTPHLADALRKRGCGNVEVVRNGVDSEAGWFPTDLGGRQPTVGWAGALPWRSGDIESVRRPLRRLESLGVRFHHSGHLGGWSTFAEAAGLADGSVSNSPMVPVEGIPRLYAYFEVGMIPLNDIPFNWAKSFVKGLEMAAAGIPFVAGASPEYRALAADGVGLVAASDSQWFKLLKALWSSEDFRRERAESDAAGLLAHTMKVRAQDWESVLQTQR